MARMPTTNAFKEWRPPDLSGGLCLDDLEWQIRDNESPSCLNVWYRDRIITKRMGQEYVNSNAISANPILAIYEKLFKTYIVVAISTKLYKIAPADGTATEIMSGLTANKGTFFVFNDVLYYINGAQYVAWTGTGSAAAVVPYIPVVVINRTPTGGGDAGDNYNRLGAGFTTWFNGNGSAQAFTLPQTGLDATTVTATVGGVAVVENTGFTVDRTTGIVTFSVAPASGTNNVKITAYKTTTAYINSIKQCRYAIAYGGELSGTYGGTRVFFGNPSSSYIYWCGLNDPTYWPENNYNLIGSADEGVNGFGKQYNLLIIFKSSQIYSMNYSFNGTTALYPTMQISASVGCDCPYTIQLINNRLVWAHSTGGVYTLVSTELENERNVEMISHNINGTRLRPGLLDETQANLQLATTVDKFGHYWLCVGTKVWAWNYDAAPYMPTGNAYNDGRNLSWWYFESINANCFASNGETLYYGDRTTGKVVYFQTDLDDFGAAISARWRTALQDFGLPDWQKTVYEIWATTRISTYSKISIYYYTDLTGDSAPTADTVSEIAGSFSWDSLTWDSWTWDVLNYLRSFKRKPKAKKVIVFAIEFRNADAGKDLAIGDLIVKWKQDRKVK